ncbi:response regulator [Salibacteraceae bacterium]|nr:response regulator [Salibacteraceae bacterium]
MIFLDLNMPEMSGLEFLSAFDQDASLALKKDSVSIHIMSSSTRISDIEAANRFSYVEGFIQKPMNVDQLKKVVG